MKDLSEENLSYLLELIATKILEGASSIIIDIASPNNLGIVKPDNTTITINNGTISANAPSINIATTSTAGIAKPDNETITVDGNGTLSVGSGLHYAEVILADLWSQAKASVDNS